MTTMSEPPAGPDVVTYGEAMVSFLADGGVPLGVASRFRTSIAGAESTVAAGLARLGRSVAWVGLVGEDPLGWGVLRGLRAEGIDMRWAKPSDTGPTGLLVRDCLADRPISVSYYRSGSAASHLAPSDIDGALFQGARIVHGTGITLMLSASAREASERAFALAHDAGRRTSFDPNFRRALGSAEESAAAARRLLPRTDYLLASQAELELLAGTNDLESGCAWALDQGVTFVAVKRGSRGCVGTDGSTLWEIPALGVQVADHVGAGDAWAVGFLDSLLCELELEACLERANLLASMAVQVSGDIDGLPTRPTLDAYGAGTEVLR
jgi:2-dehydro-3-deoxygluconokinase